MIIFFVVYVGVCCFVLWLKQKQNLNFFPPPKVIVKRDGLSFSSYSVHRVNILNNKYIQIGNKVYIRNNLCLVTINNVDRVFIYKNYLYFTGLGLVKIEFDCADIFAMFNVQIYSKNFNFQKLKRTAILELFDACFDKNKSKSIKKLKIIMKNILNIDIFQKKLVIKQNKLKLRYTLIYKLNNKIKRINVN